MDYCEYLLLLRETGFNLSTDTGCFYLQMKGFLDKAVHGQYIHVIEGLSVPSCQGEVHKCSIYFTHETEGSCFYTVHEKNNNIDNSDRKLTLNVFVDLRTTCCDLSVV